MINSKEILTDFGLAVKQLRLSKNISQEKLAELSGVHRTYIGMIERGEKNLTITNIYKIAVGLNVSVVEIFKSIEA